MKDIDFDELDRAVGTVLGSGAAAPKVPDTQPVESTAPAATAAATPTETPISSPASSDPTLAPSSTASATIRPSTSPARKRGQFLDMVHPSADMRGKSATPVNVRKKISPLTSTPLTPSSSEAEPTEPSEPESPRESPVSSYAETLAKKNTTQSTLTPEISPEVPTDLPAPELGSAPIVPDQSEDTSETAPSDTPESLQNPAWPDPIDFASNNGAEPHDEQQNEANVSSDTTSDDSDESDDSARQTPFVPGVEVEKRPLGGASGMIEPLPSAASLSTPPDASSEVSAPEEDVEPQSTSTADDLSGPELGEELNSIESSGIDETSERNDTVPLPGTTPEPEPSELNAKPIEAQEDKAQPEAASPAPVPAIAAPDAPVGAQSIPQQYKPAANKEEDDDEEGHPLFDTQEYHQPLLPASNKKSGKKGLLILVMLLVLAIVGAALGYIAFTMGL